MNDGDTAVARSIIRRRHCCGSSHVGVALLQSSSWRPWDGHTILRVRAPICGVWLHTTKTPPPRHRRRRIVAGTCRCCCATVIVVVLGLLLLLF